MTTVSHFAKKTLIRYKIDQYFKLETHSVILNHIGIESIPKNMKLGDYYLCNYISCLNFYKVFELMVPEFRLNKELIKKVEGKNESDSKYSVIRS